MKWHYPQILQLTDSNKHNWGRKQLLTIPYKILLVQITSNQLNLELCFPTTHPKVLKAFMNISHKFANKSEGRNEIPFL
jgi:hypothetical protein